MIVYLSIADKLGEGLVVSVLGMGVVFSVLVILILSISAMGSAMAKPVAVADDSTVAISLDPIQPVSVPEVSQAVTEVDSGQIIAVIAAAIAAFSGESPDNIRIASIVRRETTESGWAIRARQELTDRRPS